MNRDDLDELWRVIDLIPDAPDLETMAGDDIVKLGVELEQAAVALTNAANNYSHNARQALDPNRYGET